MLTTGPFGMLRVMMSTLPPPNAAGYLGRVALLHLNASMISVGKMSSGITLRVRSGDGTCAPFNCTLE